VSGKEGRTSNLYMHNNLWGSTLTLALSRPEGEGIWKGRRQGVLTLACQCVSRKGETCITGRRGARKTVPSHGPCEHAAVHEPPPMKPLVRKGLGKGEDGWGVARVRRKWRMWITKDSWTPGQARGDGHGRLTVSGKEGRTSNLYMHNNLWGSTLTLALSRPEGEGIWKGLCMGQKEEEKHILSEQNTEHAKRAINGSLSGGYTGIAPT